MTGTEYAAAALAVIQDEFVGWNVRRLGEEYEDIERLPWGISVGVLDAMPEEGHGLSAARLLVECRVEYASRGTGHNTRTQAVDIGMALVAFLKQRVPSRFTVVGGDETSTRIEDLDSEIVVIDDESGLYDVYVRWTDVVATSPSLEIPGYTAPRPPSPRPPFGYRPDGGDPLTSIDVNIIPELGEGA